MLTQAIKKLAVTLLVMFAVPVVAQQSDLFVDSDTLLNRLGSAIGCDLSARLKADMQAAPLYSKATGACESGKPDQSGEYFRDAGCTVGLQFNRTGQQQFCAESVDKQRLGNGAAVNTGWTLSPGTRYDIGVKPLEGLTQPYRKSVSYRRIATDAGECQLEMRIYKNSLLSDDQQSGIPLLAIHGGSWKARGFGTIGIETAAAHYTSKGFVVFAPFYRLLSDSEPNVECQSAPIEQIVDDIDAALQWVIANAANYGASGKPVIMGQSAGAHLALSTAVNFRAQVAAALLMYPPTDFTDFIDLVLAGEYTNEQGLNILSDVLGVDDASLADVTAAAVTQNSFPARIAASPGSLPPMMIFHGLADELVPASQSVRLCNALAAREPAAEVIYDGSLEQIIECGPDSRLYLYSLANHALDICLTGNELLTAACPAGGRDSQRLIAASLDQSIDELLTIAESVRASANNSTSSGGGSFSNFPLAVLLGALLVLLRLNFVTGKSAHLRE